jgi:NADH-quinone oxidoreductase subunit C
MEAEKLISTITAWSDEITFENEGQFLNVSVPPAILHEVSEKLKNENELLFDYMFCLTAVDWPACFELVYHLESSLHKHQIVLRTKTENRENTTVDTVCDLWPTAEFHEREAYDLFGILFNNHPDLRRILLDDDWVGFPMRKDYQDDVNLILK